MTSRNRIRKPLTLLLLTVLFNQPALSEQTLTVKSLRFSGNRKISDRKLLRQILTGHPAWYAWLPFVRHPRFDSGDFSNDILRLESYYKDRGYYNVSIDAQTTRREDRVELVIQIDEGIQTRLKKLSINGLHGVDSSHVIRNLTLQPPQPFRGSLLEPDKRSILNYLKNSGYPYASVSASIRLNPEDGSAFVIYHVDPGQKATFGEVVVTGNNGVSTGAIRRGLDFRPEGPFLKDRLINTQRRIYRAGAFRAVTVKPDLSDSSRTSVDVNVSVQERPFNHIRIGLGYDTEESVRGSGAWGHRNFLGGARNLTITGRASRILVEGETNFRQPFVIDSRTDLGLTAYIRRLREPGVRGTHVGGALGLSREFAKHLVGGLQYEQKLIKADQDTMLFNVRSSLVRDTRSDIFDPRFGSFFIATVEQVFVQRSKNFLRITTEGRWYRPLSGRLTFAMRLFGGAIRLPSGGRIVSSERYFAGGSASLRGWGLQELGQSVDPVRFIPRGGLYKAEGSAELRLRLPKRIGLAGFVDFGNLGDELEVYHFSNFAFAIGGGLRYNSPIGPVRFDLGYKAKDPFRSRENFGLSRYNLHFSLGQAF